MSNIARRTRSHVSIDDDVIHTDNLNFPDVEEDLYQNSDSVDHEYKDFLYQCYSEAVEQGTDTNTDDNDPAYVYNEDIFSHGWKYNVFEELPQPQQKEQTFGQDFASPQQRQREEVFGREFARVLNQQLRQSIQLLTQTYLLAKSMKNTQDEAEEAKENLNSYLKIFNDRRKPSNLLPAIQLVNDFGTPKELKSSVRFDWRPLPVPEAVKKIIEENVNIFPYVNLLPRVAFSRALVKPVKKKPKIMFTWNEDKLLALALNEFKGDPSRNAYITSLLMPAKTRMQIADHIKNTRRRKNINNIKPKAGVEESPLMDYFLTGRLPHVDLDGDSRLRACRQSPATCASENQTNLTGNMDDLMAASVTISRQTTTTERNIKNAKLRKSMMDLMSHKLNISEEMGDLIVHDFLKASQERLSERNHSQLLQLLTDLLRREVRKDSSSQKSIRIYNDVSKFLKSIEAPFELHERLVLFLNLDAATECNCALSYLHWMRVFQFVQHVLLYHEGEGVEKKLSRLVDATQKGDTHKIKLATANLINKHLLLKREYEALTLDGKPHPSLFMCEEDFDDQTEPISLYDSNQEDYSYYEHFESKLTTDEINYASRSCPCKCHQMSMQDEQQQHCGKCNLKFMKGCVYLVNKKKPCLAEWSYIDRQPETLSQQSEEPHRQPSPLPPTPPPMPPSPVQQGAAHVEWTFEEDKEILDFCRAKAEQNDENVSFDTTTFEELVMRRARNPASMKSAPQLAERFNHLMEMYSRKRGAETGD